MVAPGYVGFVMVGWVKSVGLSGQRGGVGRIGLCMCMCMYVGEYKSVCLRFYVSVRVVCVHSATLPG